MNITRPAVDQGHRDVVAGMLVGTGVIAAAIDNNGPVGFVLFILGAIAGSYLVVSFVARRVTAAPREAANRTLSAQWTPTWRLPVTIAVAGSVSLMLANQYKAGDSGVGGTVNQVAYVGIIASAVLLVLALLVMTVRAIQGYVR